MSEELAFDPTVLQNQAIEPIEPKKKNRRGGARPNSGPKTPLEVLEKRAIDEGLKIGEAKFWMNLAENKAIPKLEQLLESSDDKAAFKAVKEVLDRALGKPKEIVEHSGKVGLSLADLITQSIPRDG